MELEVDESTLTGESLPVIKRASEVFPVETPIADRDNLVMRGTSITKGTATALITHTGLKTELGKIALLTSTAQEEITPLEQHLDRLAQRLVYLTLAIAGVVFLIGWLTGKEPLLMLKTAIALAVATVPEGLPIVATLALARGLLKMAKKNALINRLSAVETLGSTTTIVTDKTGTLTENRMTVSEVFTVDTDLISSVAYHCNNAALEHGEWVGDPMEVALKKHLEQQSIEKLQRIKEFPFNAERKMMGTLHQHPDMNFLAVKGAPESILNHCTHYLEKGETKPLDESVKNKWIENNRQAAGQGLRMLAFAFKQDSAVDASQAFEKLTFLGLIGFRDPARADVPAAIEKCQNAGIRVVMATGDQVDTAKKIAQDVGLKNWDQDSLSGYEIPDTGDWPQPLVGKLKNTALFSRVNPEQKLRLVQYLQKQDEIVAMTGDGVNDAPALKKADIGIAMGIRGTDVAKEASDMILRDDRFATIVSAIEHGRIIFNNIRNFVVYLLSCNLSEVFIVSFAAALSGKIPITPLQILFLNLITDVFPALALGLGKGDQNILNRPPRPVDEKVLAPQHWRFIFVYGFVMTIIVLGLFGYLQNFMLMSLEKSVSMAFLTLGLCQLFHVFNLKAEGESLFTSTIVKNPFVWGALALCGGCFLLAFSIPTLRLALSLVPLGLVDLALAVGAGLMILIPGLFKK
jgi:Ca2+-transporting ATPase